MKRVLLAINGDIPTNPIFNYAVGLCKRISADLDILQFINAQKLSKRISFQLKNLLQTYKPGVSCTVALSAGTPETELSEYIEAHKDIVLTVFDPSTGQKHKNRNDRVMLKLLREKLTVPLVIVKF